MPDWQPIETAPRDGKDLLLFDGRIMIGYWWDARERPWQACWMHNEAGELNPTHWMPLPEPPK